MSMASEISHETVRRAFEYYFSDFDPLDLREDRRSEWRELVVRFLGQEPSVKITSGHIENIGSLSETDLNEMHLKLKSLGLKLHKDAWSETAIGFTAD